MSPKFSISESIKTLLPQCRLGVISCEVIAKDSSVNLLSEISSLENDYITQLSNTVESKLEVIAETREAYKICGKKPSRYRPSAEALLRRLRLGKALYKINNVVDTINFLSMSSQYSIGGFDSEKITGDVILDIGNSDIYQAIGRGPLNIEFMPGVKDDLGFFGTPTSDSERTMVTDKINHLVLVYYDFFGNDSLFDAMKSAKEILSKHCEAKNINTEIIN